MSYFILLSLISSKLRNVTGIHVSS